MLSYEFWPHADDGGGGEKLRRYTWHWGCGEGERLDCGRVVKEERLRVLGRVMFLVFD